MYHWEIIICLILLYVYFIQFSHGTYPVELINEITFKSGDLIIFKAQNNFNALWLGSYYTHMGIVYESNGELLIFEANGLEHMPARPEHFKKGILLTQLLPRIKQYKGRVFLKPLKYAITAEQYALFTDFIKFAHEKFYYDTRVIHRRIQNLIGARTVDYRTDCGEMLFHLLVKLKMLEPSGNVCHLHKISILTTVKNNEYGDLIELKHYPYVMPSTKQPQLTTTNHNQPQPTTTNHNQPQPTTTNHN